MQGRIQCVCCVSPERERDGRVKVITWIDISTSSIFLRSLAAVAEVTGSLTCAMNPVHTLGINVSVPHKEANHSCDHTARS